MQAPSDERDDYDYDDTDTAYDDEYDDTGGWQPWHVVVLILVLMLTAALLVFVVLPWLEVVLFPPAPLPPLQQPLQT